MARNIAWTQEGWDAYVYWQGQDRKTLKRINRLIDAVVRDPFGGIVKPEPLKENLSGLWSRRIDENHRLVYAVNDDTVTILSCRYHYG